MNTRPITDADIYAEVIHPWEDAHPAHGPDEDSLRAYFADELHQDWPRQPELRRLAGWSAAVAGAALTILALIWLVTA